MKERLTKRLDYRVTPSFFDRLVSVVKSLGYKNETEYIREKLEKAVTNDEKKAGKK